MSEACIFLGPTLAVADATAELDAVYLPPVSAGDVCRLWHRHPRAIGIVDGHFKRVPAVWHKEIMWIMERGVHVFGSGSMGALRAAELDSFGMRGVGGIYQAFKDGTLDRDDELAVAYETGSDGYRKLSEAMVNIRATLRAAHSAEIISDALRHLLTAAGTALFYQERTWPALLEAGKAEGADPAELNALRRWLPAGRIDQQAADAMAMLREMHGFLATSPAPLQVRWTMASTTRWQAAKRHADSMRGPSVQASTAITGTDPDGVTFGPRNERRASRIRPAPSIGRLADELADIELRNDPFGASFMAVSGYDDAVPDLSPECQQAWRDRLVDVIVRCDQCEAGLPDDGGVLLEAVRDKASRALATADSRVDEFSVTTFPLAGPSLMLLIASRTRISDPASAAAYLTRCRRLPTYLDQYTEVVRAAARSGLLPVAPLVSDALRQVRDHLSHPGRDPMLSPRPPAGWGGAAAWRDEIERAVRDGIRPAIARYTELLSELLPKSRPPEQAGLLHVPGGLAAYACCVRVGTTLPLDPDEIHRIGLSALAEIEERMAELGRQAMGARTAGDVMARLRDDVTLAGRDGTDAMTRAAKAIARAQERLPEMFHPPMPPPCAVEPMPPHMAEFGAPPYYSPPAPDGLRPGAYLFNSAHPGPAGSWALEATAFHEAVPGHHTQFARLQIVPRLPRLLTAFYVVPHGEGWGLYAERLADEFGLYSDDAQRLGMLGCAAWRAVRLVVDTGLHARGWTRAGAREFALAHSPMPQAFVDAEIDRYIAIPGQALGYHLGQREILRLRQDAQARLGAAYDIRDFHSTILGHGYLPLAVLRKVVETWTSATAA